jgi:hypothetical protein
MGWLQKQIATIVSLWAICTLQASLLKNSLAVGEDAALLGEGPLGERS